MFSANNEDVIRFQVKGINARGYIEAITDPVDIDQANSRRILVESFIDEYSKYLQPSDIDASLTCWRGKNSVQAYYEKYFNQEFKKFSEGKFEFWICAYIGAKLVGWATFEREMDNHVYMDLLIVDPVYKYKGIGEQLVKSQLNLNVMPELTAVHLLLRKRNLAGRKFYEKLGFLADENYKRKDNFVDLELLTPLTWNNPKLTAQNTSTPKLK